MIVRKCLSTTPVVLLIVCTLLVSSSVFSQHVKTVTDQLARDADVIVVGRVGTLKAEWNANKSRIQTRVTIAVNSVLKGDAGQQTISLVVPGGEVDGVGEWYSHSPRFLRSEDVVVFAKKDARGSLRVASGEQGKLTIKQDSTTGAKIIPNVGTLAQFTSHLRTALASRPGPGR